METPKNSASILKDIRTNRTLFPPVYGIVRILDNMGQTTGTGFLINSEGLIVTCAHVVKKAKGGPGKTIQIAFLADGKVIRTYVDKERWRDPDSEDIAILRPLENVPETATPFVLRNSICLPGQVFRTFGFPNVKPVEGLAGVCEIVGETTERGIRVLQVRSDEITAGFSGAPLIDPDTECVIGVISALLVKDEFGRLSNTAFAIPIEIINSICPEVSTLSFDSVLNPGIEVESDKRTSCFVQDDGIRTNGNLGKENPPLSTFFISPRRKYFNAYLENLPYELGNLNFLGRAIPLNLENIYVSLHLSQHRRLDMLPNIQEGDFKTQQEALERLQAKTHTFNIESALKLSTRLIILGDPGAGKTTLLKHLAIRVSKAADPILIGLEKKNVASRSKTVSDRRKKDMPAIVSGLEEFFDGFAFIFRLLVGPLLSMRGYEMPIPVYITLNKVTNSNQSIRQEISSILNKFIPLKQNSWFIVEKALGQGKVLCILDGLDEIVDDRIQKDVVQEIDRLIAKYPKNYYVIASRIGGFKYLFEHGFHLLDIVEFDQEQIERFISCWPWEKPELGEELRAALLFSPRMCSLAVNPLLLSIIALVFEQDTRLPTRRVDLYERCIWVMLEEWDRLKKIKHNFTSSFTLQVLENLALRFHEQGLVILPRDKLIIELRKYFNDRRDYAYLFLEEIVQRTGLFKQFARDSFGFTHLTIQEYLAARYLHRQLKLSIDGIVTYPSSHYPDSWWHEIIILLAGLQRNATQLIQNIIANNPESWDLNILAAKCFADADETDPKLYIKIIDWIISYVKDAEKPDLLPGVKDLGDAFGDYGWKRIISMIDDPDENNRVKIIGLIGAIGSKQAISTLLDLAQRERSLKVRNVVFSWLEKIGGADIVNALLAQISS